MNLGLAMTDCKPCTIMAKDFKLLAHFGGMNNSKPLCFHSGVSGVELTRFLLHLVGCSLSRLATVSEM